MRATTDPPPVRDWSAERLQAMAFAVDLYQGDFVKRGDDRSLTDTADVIFHWFVQPVMAFFEFGPVLEQDTKYPTSNTFGGSMTQLKDSEQVRITIKARDAKGAEVGDDPSSTGDDITWSSADTSIATVNVVDPRNVDVIAGTVGSTVVSATLPNGVVVTQAFDVIPGNAVAMEFSVGEPTEQAPAAPAAPAGV